MDWNTRCVKSIEKEKMEVEKKYGIRITQTQIYCATCGKIWDSTGHHGCPGSTAHQPMVGKRNKPAERVERFLEGKKGIIRPIPAENDVPLGNSLSKSKKPSKGKVNVLPRANVPLNL